MNENGANSNTSGKSVVSLAFAPKKTGDNLSDAILGELARRLLGTLELNYVSDIWDQGTEPTDKSLIWWPRDPITKARVGKPKSYDTVTGTWKELGGETPAVYKPRKRRNGFVDVGAGGSEVNVTFEDFSTTDFHVTLTPHLFQAGAYVAAPGTMNNFALAVTGRTSASFSFHAYTVPTGGIRVEWEIAEKAAETPV